MPRTIIFDFETIPNEALVPNAVGIRATLKAPGNYKDPVKIAANIDEQMAEVVQNMGLHPLTGRICAAGYIIFDGATESERGCTILGESSDQAEAELLSTFTERIRGYDRLIGFNSKKFDANFYNNRARILQVKPVTMSTHPYANDDHVDLMLLLGSPIKLDAYRVWYGVGKETPEMGDAVWRHWQAGEKEVIRAHCLDDVDATLKLAQLLGVMPRAIINKGDFQ